ncbi:MAG: 50S ribosomal protein L18 [Opitutales bacterium]
MSKTSDNRIGRIRRKSRIRRKISGTSDRPRLAVFRSNRYLYAQLINDEIGVTLASASTLEKDLKGSPPTVEIAKKVGALIGGRAKEKGVDKVVFDRGGYRFHGVVKALGEGAREAGLKF